MDSPISIARDAAADACWQALAQKAGLSSGDEMLSAIYLAAKHPQAGRVFAAVGPIVGALCK